MATQKKSEFIDVSAIVREYVSKWYWFAISVVVCVALGWLATKVIKPKYAVNANVLISQDEKGGMASLGSIGDLFGSKASVDDEIFVISSHSVYRDVVKDLATNKIHKVKMGFLNNVFAYPEFPVDVIAAPGIIDTLRTTIVFKVKIDEKGKKYNQLINRQGREAFYKSSETGRCATPTQIGNVELVVNKLKAFDQLYYIEIIKRLNDLKLYMENNIDPKEFYMPNPIISKGSSEYFIDSRSLPRVIAKLKQINPGKFDLLLDAYKSLFPDIEDVIVKEIQISSEGTIVVPDDIPFIVSDSIYLLFVRDKNLCRLIDFEAMSDGAKRVFMILTKIIMASLEERNISLIAIEEPENSIHPSLFRTYLQIISDLLDDCKVIITSHSPYIISFMDLGSIYVGIHRDGGMAEFHGFKKNKEKTLEDDADSLDMGMGDYIFSMLADNESEIEGYLECDAVE